MNDILPNLPEIRESKGQPYVLVVDDNLERHEYYKTLYKDQYAYLEAHNPYEAFEILTSNPKLALLHLDYDLYELPYPEPYLNGMAVVDFILDTQHFDPDKRPSKIIIHSMNVKGAISMQRKLRENGIRPTMEPFPIDKMPWWDEE